MKLAEVDLGAFHVTLPQATSVAGGCVAGGCVGAEVGSELVGTVVGSDDGG